MMDAFLASIRRRGVRVYLVSPTQIELDDPGAVLTEPELVTLAGMKPLIIHALKAERARLHVVASWDKDLRRQFEARAEAFVRIEGHDPNTAERLAYEALYPTAVTRAYAAAKGAEAAEDIIDEIWGQS